VQAYSNLQKAIELAPKHLSTTALTSTHFRNATRRIFKADKHKLGSRLQERDGRAFQNYPDDLDAATLYAESMMNSAPVAPLDARRQA
jgi:hypothetical protein